MAATERRTGKGRASRQMVGSDTAARVRSSTRAGLTPPRFANEPADRLADTLDKAWSRLRMHWDRFTEARRCGSSSSGTRAANTFKYWLSPLLKELGYPQLSAGTAVGQSDSPYTIYQSCRNVTIVVAGHDASLVCHPDDASPLVATGPYAYLCASLNSSANDAWGLVSNGMQLRLLQRHHGLSHHRYIEFDIEAVMNAEKPEGFADMWMMCHRSHFENDGPGQGWLEQWSMLVGKQDSRTLSSLRGAVTRAIELLGTGLIAHPRNDTLRSTIESGQLSAHKLYGQLIHVVYRLMFLCLAEDRGLLHPRDATAAARAAYNDRYSTWKLRAIANESRPAAVADYWDKFDFVSASLARADGCPSLGIPCMASFLWDSEATPDLLGPHQSSGRDAVCVSDHDMVEVIRSLGFIEQDRRADAVEYQTFRPSWLGSIYEHLLARTPRVSVADRTVLLDSASHHERKATGAYYTPDSLVDHLLGSALEPVVHERLAEAARVDSVNEQSVQARQEQAILSTKVCDPSAGGGHFLLAAGRRLASFLARIRTGDRAPTREQYQRALSEVVRHGLYGVDSNPMAVEICRIALWIEADDPDLKLADLESKIRVGDALLGATPDGMNSGVPSDAFKSDAEDNKKIVAYFRRRNQAERKAYRAIEDDGRAIAASSAEHERLLADAWCAAFVWKKHDIDRPDVLEGCTGKWNAISEAVYRQLEKNPGSVASWMKDEIARLTQQYRFFHWHQEFPEVFSADAVSACSESLPDEKPGTLTASDATRQRRRGFDVIVGNPPFLNQRESATAAKRGPAALLCSVTDGAVRGYSDLSAAFLLQAKRLCRSGGRVALVQPQSLLTSKDARSIRSAVLDDASLVDLWISNEHVFEGAGVFTCAPTLSVGAPRVGTVLRHASTRFVSLPSIEVDNDRLQAQETWGHLAAAAMGVPEFGYTSSGVVGDIATATADFRDQYYGLDGFVVEDADVDCQRSERDRSFPPLVTSGCIDLATCEWGRRPTRLLKASWHQPRIDRERMRTEGTLSGWITNRLVPKVIVATQTKVLEVLIDTQGRYVPSLPLITVLPRARGDLWKIAAAIASPVSVGLAMQRYAGAALTAQAIKLSAKQVLSLPLPQPSAVWNQAAQALRDAHDADPRDRRAQLIRFASLATDAYKLAPADSEQLLDWWQGRLAP